MTEGKYEIACFTYLINFPSERFPALIDRRCVLRRCVRSSIGRLFDCGADGNDLGVRRKQPIELRSVDITYSDSPAASRASPRSRKPPVSRTTFPSRNSQT